MNRTLLFSAVFSLVFSCGLAPVDDAQPAELATAEQHLMLPPVGPGPVEPPIVVDPGPWPTPRVIDVGTAELQETQVDIVAGTVYETRNCTRGTDPVMHLMAPSSSTTGNVNRVQLAVDDNSAGAPNARVTVPTRSGQSIGFLLLRAQGEARGRCDIYRNNLPWKSNQPVGGKMVTLTAAAGDALETVARPGGPTLHQLYRVSGASLVQRIVTGGTGNGARAILPSTTVTYLVGAEGTVRLVVNDPADADGDGLGNLLEAELQTCSGLNTWAGSFDCSIAATTRDTDGDGLTDFWEVLGKRDQFPHQLLPAWGANPRHKDVFVEVDLKSSNQFDTYRMPAEQARRAARYFADVVETNSPLIDAYRAVMLRNPDGLKGMRLHLDTGRMPELNEDLTLYGAWGGFNVVSPANSTNPDGSINYNTWRDQMVAARRGVFRYVLGNPGNGGQNNGLMSVAGLDDGEAVAHELGHSLGLAHAGAPSAGDQNCKPQYASIMSYAYAYVTDPPTGFTDGLGPSSITNVALTEYGALATAADRERYPQRYEKVFGYYVDRTTWSVDYDRDGVIAPQGTTVRAYANNAPGDSCEGTRHRRNALTTNAVTAASPALARVNGRVVVLSVNGASVQANSALDTFYNCVAPGGKDADNPCGTFTAPTNLIGGAKAVDAVRRGIKLLVVYVDLADQLRYGLLTVGATGTVSFQGVPTPIASGVMGEPSLAVDVDDSVLVVFKGSDGLLYESRHTTNTASFSPAQPAQGPQGQSLTLHDSPGIGVGKLPGDASMAMYLHASTSLGSGMYRRDAATGRYTLTSTQFSPSNRRPSVLWVPPTAGSADGHLIAIEFYGEGVPMVRRSGRRYDRTAGVVTDFGFRAHFDNAWLKTAGMDVMFDPGLDSNLRAVMVPTFGAWNGKPVFEPMADGIVDLRYGTFNDWEKFGQNTCRSVNNPGNLVTNPVTCP